MIKKKKKAELKMYEVLSFSVIKGHEEEAFVSK